jgi:Zn-dependent M16 (insulinase) family peptidase
VNVNTRSHNDSNQRRNTPSKHPAFELISETAIDSLKVVVEQYRHLKTEAVHYHINADHDENVFMVALRTVPGDSTGVAHILEHTALCGSEKYPVRDPFFMMIRRSLNTFMNAFTSSDWTAYPFASQNKKDFDNLLHIYLDAVFFSRLDPLDFAQEGHRLEFADKANPDSDLEFKGVVYNEMKGAMSSPTSLLWQALTSYLNPTNTYHYNSGGDPEHIVDLTYEQLKHFYKTHYHPTNAVFMTFGDLPAEQHHERFESLALKRFNKLDELIEVADEKRYYAPIQVTQGYPVEDGVTEAKTHLVVGWLLGHSTNLEELLEASFLNSLLLDHSASPLRKVLEQTDLGRSPSPLCGLEDSNKEMAFMCGLEGSEPEKTSEFEALVLETLEQVAQTGLPQSTLESVLHQLELAQREIGGDGYPYGMQLMLAGLSGAIHCGSFVNLIDLDPAIAMLREKIQKPGFVGELIHKYLLNNPHRVTLTFYPDEHFSKRRAEQEKKRLAVIKSALSESQTKTIILQAQALEKRQSQHEDESVLPKVGLEDIKPDVFVLHPQRHSVKDSEGKALEGWTYEQGTNGLVYQQLIAPLAGVNL